MVESSPGARSGTMPKLKSAYRCQSCGAFHPKWMGQCPACGQWNTLAEEVVEEPAAPADRPRQLTEFSTEPVRLGEVEARPAPRCPIGIAELDRLLGGGLVPGQMVLLAGPPGIGKSTLLLQVVQRLADQGLRCLYASGEESLGQVSSRAGRLGLQARQGSEVYLVCETNLNRLLERASELRSQVLVVDSIQTACHPELSSGAGSVGQVRECAAEILRWAKARDVTSFLLGHVTKEGTLAGPKVLEHIVDTVLYFESENHPTLRVLRAHKNRFGPTSEVAFLEMGDRGLKAVEDPSRFLLRERLEGEAAGRALTVAVEGTRPVFAEVQALVAPARYGVPRRLVTGLDYNRTQVLLAALERHARLDLSARDVFVSLAGGMRLEDPGVDLAVAVAVFSSARDVPIPEEGVFAGEVGLLGDLRQVGFLEARFQEALRAGFRSLVVGGSPLEPSRVPEGLEVRWVRTLQQALALLGGAKRPNPVGPAMTEAS